MAATDTRDTRARTVERFLDAAERLLIEVGFAGITTRRLANEAGANQGLVHYYFGSMDELLVQVLERFTGRLVERQRELYARDVPFLEKWRTAMAYMEEDLESGYPKIWYELQALAWNRPELLERVAHVHDEWRGVLADAFTAAVAEYGLDPAAYPVDAVVALVMTFTEGVFLDRLTGIDSGHRELFAWIDGWLSSLEEASRR